MTSEQHKAEMITLHTNLMDAQSKVKKDIKFLTEKRDLIMKNSGGVASMSEAEKRNYEMFCSLIENANTHLLVSQAAITKYQDLYNKQALFIQKYQTPFIRLDFINYLNGNLDEFLKTQLEKYVHNKDFNFEPQKEISTQ